MVQRNVTYTEGTWCTVGPVVIGLSWYTVRKTGRAVAYNPAGRGFDS